MRSENVWGFFVILTDDTDIKVALKTDCRNSDSLFQDKISSNKYLSLADVPILSVFVFLAESRSKIKNHSKQFVTYQSYIKIKCDILSLLFIPCVEI